MLKYVKLRPNLQWLLIIYHNGRIDNLLSFQRRLASLRAYLCNNSVTKLWMPWSDCMTAQANLGLPMLHKPGRQIFMWRYVLFKHSKAYLQLHKNFTCIASDKTLFIKFILKTLSKICTTFLKKKFFSEKTSHDISCESSAKQASYEMSRLIFFEKWKKKKKFKMWH